MKFRKLTIENYKSFQFPTTINFADGSEGKSIFLIGGMNGAGKTSVM
jgi:DNA sulfur modification protein DndD